MISVKRYLPPFLAVEPPDEGERGVVGRCDVCGCESPGGMQSGPVATADGRPAGQETRELERLAREAGWHVSRRKVRCPEGRLVGAVHWASAPATPEGTMACPPCCPRLMLDPHPVGVMSADLPSP